MPTCPEEGRPRGCLTKLVEDGPPEPGHRSPQAQDCPRGPLEPETWCKSLKYCFFHPELVPVLVNASCITSNDRQEHKASWRRANWKRSWSQRHNLCSAKPGPGVLVTEVSWVTVARMRSSGPTGVSGANRAGCVGQLCGDSFPEGRNHVGGCWGSICTAGQGDGCSLGG